jgi:uncharacterized protein
MSGTFVIYKDKADQYRFRLNAANGENIGASEGYTAKASAQNGIESVGKNCSNDDNYEVFKGKDTKHYFRLKAANGEIILSSQGYSSKDAANEGTQAVKRNAPDANVDDQDK